MRPRFREVVEQAIGKRVVGSMSGTQQDPYVICEVFVLAPTRPRRRAGRGPEPT